ncbi:hypothetical protein [Peribacillus huizhouensis]|uniref:Uncharacterized protein n=1 Tax=Peribacillus huizhouensis TaxID=1501239 RepID=A0ABR6CS46_9BACI|nr:hypothetical protein [Peribacillus huizhouensis]MBA9027478.1 hypothetical protein [Peribacillus huizhouensis]
MEIKDSTLYEGGGVFLNRRLEFSGYIENVSLAKKQYYIRFT